MILSGMHIMQIWDNFVPKKLLSDSAYMIDFLHKNSKTSFAYATIYLEYLYRKEVRDPTHLWLCRITSV